MSFEIEFLEDIYECGSCGWTEAQGYVIRKDGEIVVDKTPVASCFDGADYRYDSPYRDLIYYLHPDIQIITKEAEDE